MNALDTALLFASSSVGVTALTLLVHHFVVSYRNNTDMREYFRQQSAFEAYKADLANYIAYKAMPETDIRKVWGSQIHDRWEVLIQEANAAERMTSSVRRECKQLAEELKISVDRYDELWVAYDRVWEMAAAKAEKPAVIPIVPFPQPIIIGTPRTVGISDFVTGAASGTTAGNASIVSSTDKIKIIPRSNPSDGGELDYLLS